MEKKETSWGWIIFWLIIFWPVGLFLAVKKLANDKSASMRGKTTGLSAIGWILTAWATLMFIVFVSDPSSFTPAGAFLVVMVFIPLAGGILLLRKVSKTKKQAAKYKKYIDIVVNQNVRSIDYVASAVNLSYDTVAKELQEMIHSGYLREAYIHQGNREIILKEYHGGYAQTAVVGQAAPRTTAVRCSGCGANNVVTVGGISECEYCATPLKA